MKRRTSKAQQLAISKHFKEKEQRYRFDKGLLEYYISAKSLDVHFTTGLRVNENNSYFKTTVIAFNSANQELNQNWNELNPNILKKLEGLANEINLDSPSEYQKSADHLFSLFIDEINSDDYPYLEDDIKVLVDEFYNGEIREKWNDFIDIIHHKNSVDKSTNRKSHIDAEINKYLNTNLRRDKGWNYAFESEMDFLNFKDVLINFILDDTIPKDISIKLKSRSMAAIGSALGEIHRLTNCKSLTKNKRYFELARCLNHFKKLTDTQIYDKMTH